MSGVAWNSGDKSANISLSGGNLTAASTSNTQGAVRCNTSAASGKIYYECTLGTFGGSNTGIGWANATAGLGAFIGVDTNGVASFPTDGPNGQVWFNNAVVGSGGGPRVGSGLDTFCIAFDISNQLLWVKIRDLPWNNSGSASPFTGSGGISVAGIGAGPYFPAFCSNVSGSTVTANFGASQFVYPIPTGFTTLDTSGVGYSNFAASTKFEGLGALAIPQQSGGATKFEGLSALATDQRSADATKFEGLGALATPQRSGGATKFLGYAILTPLTERCYGYIFG